MKLPGARSIRADFIALPVRHHSPACARFLVDRLDREKPEVLCIEAPIDAEPLVALFNQHGTEPPFAMLGYRRRGSKRKSLWPFCDYSPELAAVLWALRNGASVRFMDLPVTAWLGPLQDDEGEQETRIAPDLNVYPAIATSAGFRTYEEFWESRFEQFPGDADAFFAAMEALAVELRSRQPKKHLDREAIPAREAHMMSVIAAQTAPRVAVVCGAFHLPPLRKGEVDWAALEAIPETPPARIVLMPYSFLRLSEQSGYGAGNRAPMLYQRAWELKGDWRGATRRVLLETVQTLSAAGHQASLSDAIDAEVLATNLAGLRDKPSPGLEEVVEAVQSCLERGGSGRASKALREHLVGSRVGRVPSSQNTSLLEEFNAGVKRFHDLGVFPEIVQDKPNPCALSMEKPLHREASTFLHRLTVLEVPFGRLTQAGADQWMRITREQWQVSWSTEVHIKLFDQSVYGDTLSEAAGAMILRKLKKARTVRDASHLLLEAVLSQAPGAYDAGLEAVRNAAATEDDFKLLAYGTHNLFTALSFKKASDVDPGLLAGLATEVFRRAAMALLPSSSADDAAARELAGCMLYVNNAAKGLAAADADLWYEKVKELLTLQTAHPLLSGFAGCLLHGSERIDRRSLLDEVALRLSPAAGAENAARFIEGLFLFDRHEIVHDRELAGGLNKYVAGMSDDEFRRSLPLLARSFRLFTDPESRAFAETLAPLLKAERVRHALAALGGEAPAAVNARAEELLARWKGAIRP